MTFAAQIIQLNLQKNIGEVNDMFWTSALNPRITTSNFKTTDTLIKPLITTSETILYLLMRYTYVAYAQTYKRIVITDKNQGPAGNIS